MRKEVLESMYGVFLENISRETDEKFNAVGEYVFGITEDEQDRDNVGLILADLMKFVFMESANMLLDFISGKDVKV